MVAMVIIIDGSLFGKKVHSRRPDTQTSKVEERGKAEFQGFKLRRTLSQDQQVQSPPGGSGNRHDFGIKLKVSIILYIHERCC